ncbi:restriction enzyme LlaI protein [Geminocystis sp. NIES-3708]|uniref:AAA family ATPase n=1 Tax=Geminocystis sp. NIES-3708 TaxID=1615909 RepID=UPI0005FC8861|nr:AAA family ATPase [Geminocystis sp. NIES-3708]BAQ61664.1 restriction enzyme LlaI protein [Geminocystis sp. NIES-3708]
MPSSPIQKILFGNPGTGKSFKIVNQILPNDLKINEKLNPENVVKTVFHPEYTYGDFMGKLVPITKGKNVQYKFHEGHFLRALAQAYKNILDHYDDPTKNKDYKFLDEEKKIKAIQEARQKACKKANNVALIIDEINRGNSSAIFGTVFQLLDRDDHELDNGWSSYSINITEIELLTILRLIGVEEKELAGDGFEYKFPHEDHWVQNLSTFQNRVECLYINLDSRSIKIPPNLSILGTMNTSDNSIYFMDSAFKRRWEWEFIDWEENNDIPEPKYGNGHPEYWGYLEKDEWRELVRGVNKFIKSHHQSIRGIEDKQIGFYFIKNYPVTSESIRNKLMFFLWDSVFNRDKKPLLELLDLGTDQLVTFGDFTRFHNLFIEKIKIKYDLNIVIDIDENSFINVKNLDNIPF